MITHDELQQGSLDWLQHRSAYCNASDAPAMMGESPYKTRTQLLSEKASGLIPEVDPHTQRIFDDGHRFEALARHLAAEIIGEDLYPQVGTKDDLSASFDGLTMAAEINFEHKTLNNVIRSCTNANELPLYLKIQMEQQMYVADAKKTLFMASKWDDTGELVEEKHFWYEPDPVLRQQIIEGWAQFISDMTTFKPEELVVTPQAEPIMQLPAVIIQVTGELVICNMQDVLPQYDRFLTEANTHLVTDEDFANGEAYAKDCRKTAKDLKRTARATIDQILPVSEAVRTLENYAERFDKLGLTLEKAVKEQKEAIKARLIFEAKNAFNCYLLDLANELEPLRLEVPEPQFAAVIKGKRTVSSLKDAIDTELAKNKIASASIAKSLRDKLAWFSLNASDHRFLFNDLQQIAYKPMDDFMLMVSSRIEGFKKVETERLEAERIKIEAEETAKAEARAQQIIKDEADRVERDRLQKQREEDAMRRQEQAIREAELRRSEQEMVIRAEEERSRLAKERLAAEQAQASELIVQQPKASLAIALEPIKQTAAIESITIPLADYLEMTKRLEWLDCLEESGVDDWIGMGAAKELYKEVNRTS